jgi:hypothetical protein
MAYGRILYGEELIFLEGSGLRGVQSVDTNFNIPFEPVVFGGNMFAGATIKSSKPTSSFSFDSLVVNSGRFDPIVGMPLWDSPISGVLHSQIEPLGGDPGSVPTGNWSFTSGYISKYSSSCAVAEVAATSCEIRIFGDVDSTKPENLFPSAEKIDEDNQFINIAKAGDITLVNVTGQDSNRIQSYSYNLTINRLDSDHLGGNYRNTIHDVMYPIEVDLSFVIDVDNMEPPLLSSLLCNPDLEDITIQLGDCSKPDSGPIRSFLIENPILVSMQETSSISEPLQAQLTYKSYIKNINNLASLIF